MLFNFFYKKIYHIVYRKTVDRPITNILNKKFNFIGESPTYYFRKFGNKNKNKLFYVIKVYEKIKEGGGLFSNVLFVLRHLQIVERLNAIPVIDFENFYNRYNEKNSIEGTKNSWLYYFDKVSKYDLNEIYQSQNVLVTNGFFSKNMNKDFYNDKDLKYIF